MYYSKRDVLDKLHIADSTLYQMVSDGRLHPFMPPHRQRGALFDSDEVDAIAAAMTIPADAQVVRFGTIDEPDLAHVVCRLLEQFPCEEVLSLREMRGWWSTNPYMFIGLKKRDGFFAGHLGLAHVDVASLHMYLRDEIPERDLTLLPYTMKPLKSDSPYPSRVGAYYSDYCITTLDIDPDDACYDAMARGLKLLLAKLGQMNTDIGSITYRSKLADDREIELERRFFRSLGFQEEQDTQGRWLYQLPMSQQVQTSSAATIYLVEYQNSWRSGQPRELSFQVEEQYILYPNGLAKTVFEVFGRSDGHPHVGPKRGRPKKKPATSPF